MADLVISESSSHDCKKLQKGRESIGEFLDSKKIEYMELQKQISSIIKGIDDYKKDIDMSEFNIKTAQEAILELEDDYKIKNTILLEKKVYMENIEYVLEQAGNRLENKLSSTVNSPVIIIGKEVISTSGNSSAGKRPKKTTTSEKKNTTPIRSPGRKRKQLPTESISSTPTKSRSRQTTPNKRQKKNGAPNNSS